jgi:glycogen debranching enzyme
MPLGTVSILEGNTFVVSDARGDLEATPTENHGLFLNDTRFLSRWILTVNGIRPKLLSTDDLAYYKVQFFSALTTGTIYVDSHLSVIRQREVNGGFHEEIILVNHDKQPLDVEVRMEADADFADLFEVKDKLVKKGESYRRAEHGRLVFGYRREAYKRETVVSTSETAEIVDSTLIFRATIPSHGRWSTRLNVDAVWKRGIGRPTTASGDGARRAEINVGVDAWLRNAPVISSSWEPLARIYRRSLVDLAALRFQTPFAPEAIPAAGLPWFMTVFGRDSLITSFQALPFVPSMAGATLKTLSVLQGVVDDAFRDEEPGKILHELRFGEMTAFEERPHSPYYGAADATPLFLVLLEEYERWTGDHALARSLEPNVRAAIDWIDRYGDRDGDGYIEYERRNKESGLDNQCWKDSWDSIAFADGTLAPTPRATCELQGYVYDAKRRVARLAREIYGDPEWASALERQAAELKERFNRDFWIPERSFFALALDGGKRKVDALTSNIGHLLWSGIADEDKARSCVEHLMSDALFSGWGVRTMGTGEGSYNPIGYHVGTVWPHDTSIVAWGMRRYGYRKEAATLAAGMLDAAELFHERLPEAFAGYPREETHYPVEYPTACSPQAWATGAPLLLVRTLLGLDSDGRHLIIDPALPPAIGRLELLDVPGVWGQMDAFGRAREAPSSSRP